MSSDRTNDDARLPGRAVIERARDEPAAPASEDFASEVEVEAVGSATTRSAPAVRLIDTRAGRHGGKSSRLRPQRATMLSRVNFWVRLALWWFFAKVTFAPRQVATIREAAERGRVVYVMQTRSLFDQLYFNAVFLEHGLPLARWSNGIRTMFLRPFLSLLGLAFRRRDRRSELEKLAACLRRDRAALLFLERPLDSEPEKRVWSQPALERLVELQREEMAQFGDRARSLQLVPLMVIWERRSEEFRPTLLDGVFGSRQSPGFFRKIVHVAKNLWQPFFLMGAPLVQIGEVVEVPPLPADAETASLAEALRARLSLMLEQQRAVVVGPPYKKGAVIKREILQDERFRGELARIAAEEGRAIGDVTQAAREDLDKIAADFRLLAIKFMAVLLSPVFQLIYDGLEVDEEGLERVRQAARDHRIVVIPSHKSHIDYLIVSSVFYQAGLIPPHIVAGDNLDFPPVGALFRRSGAFFIKRTFKGDQVYALALATYIGKILAEGYPIEFFIEGGRSRTGKLLAPRFGVLRMVLDRFLAGDVEKLKIVPVAVTYERVIEAKAHHKEVAGGEKRQENLGALIRSTSVLTSKYGRLYVDFGELIDARDYLERYGALPACNGTEADDEAVARLTQRLGYRVIYEINQAGPVTPSALTSLALLTTTTRSISRARLHRLIGFVLDLLIRRGVRLSGSIKMALASKRAVLKGASSPVAPDDATSLAFLVAGSSLADEPQGVGAALEAAAEPSEADAYTLLGRAVSDLTDEAIRLFSDSKLIEITTLDRGGDKRREAKTRDLEAPPAEAGGHRFYYSVPEERRGELSYYKNTIVHSLVPEALLSAALLEPGTAVMELEPLMERTLFLSKLFKHEFFYEERAEFERVFWRTFDKLAARGWVATEGEAPHTGAVRIAQPAPALEFFRSVLLTFLEAYTLVAVELEPMMRGRWVEEKEIVEHLLLTCQAYYHEGRVRFSETLAKPTFLNALRRYVEWGHVRTRSEERRRKTVRLYQLVEESEPQVLVERLRGLLRTRKAAASGEER